MIRDQREYSATFMGVSFYENLDGSSLQSSSMNEAKGSS